MKSFHLKHKSGSHRKKILEKFFFTRAPNITTQLSVSLLIIILLWNFPTLHSCQSLLITIQVNILFHQVCWIRYYKISTESPHGMSTLHIASSCYTSDRKIFCSFVALILYYFQNIYFITICTFLSKSSLDRNAGFRMFSPTRLIRPLDRKMWNN